MYALSNELQKRYDAFWANDAVDRVLTYIQVSDPVDLRPEGMSDEDFTVYKWSDIDYRARLSREALAHTRYYLDGFPTRFINFGPGSLAAAIGGSFRYAPDTVWFDRDPLIKDWNDRPKLRFDENSEIWRKTVEFTDAVLNDGLMFASVSDIGGNMDIAASLRGTQDLLFDLYDYPDEVKELLAEIRILWKQAFSLSYEHLRRRQHGMTTWMPVWCGGSYAPLQCDFSAMISPDMFREFVLPDLIDSTEFLDYSIYHLDGVGEFPHLEMLLSIPRLNAIQWTSGAGAEDVTSEQWFELYDRIQAAGKGIVLFTDMYENVERLIDHISPRGLYLNVNCPDDYSAKQLSELIVKKGLNGK